MRDHGISSTWQRHDTFGRGNLVERLHPLEETTSRLRIAWLAGLKTCRRM
jgi:hypothetical protein